MSYVLNKHEKWEIIEQVLREMDLSERQITELFQFYYAGVVAG